MPYPHVPVSDNNRLAIRETSNFNMLLTIINYQFRVKLFEIWKLNKRLSEGFRNQCKYVYTFETPFAMPMNTDTVFIGNAHH